MPLFLIDCWIRVSVTAACTTFGMRPDDAIRHGTPSPFYNSSYYCASCVLVFLIFEPATAARRALYTDATFQACQVSMHARARPAAARKPSASSGVGAPYR